MGLPEINIEFHSKAVSAVSRSQRGIVALILRDATITDMLTDTVSEYKVITDVKSEDWTAANLDLIKKTMLSAPYKVIVVRGDTEDEDYNLQLSILASKKWNWLAVPGIASADTADITAWIKSQRNSKKTFKAVLPNSTANDEGIVNFTTEGIVTADKTYAASDYTGRIAGALAALPLTRSATYLVLDEVTDIIESVDPDADIDAGKLILIKDDEQIKIGRGVNSLATVTAPKSEDWKSIEVVEGIDLITEDLRSTFNKQIGTFKNSYDNQVLVLVAANAYLSSLENTVLDAQHDNRFDIDIEKQRLAWESIGTDVSDLSDQQVKDKPFRKQMFVMGNLKFLQAFEDISFGISIQ
ncbi:MAG TPA: phage tail sheath subtilisin-like domain-containing protein [Candidatus Paenibacillus intestinavium]|nr:phage tail sheath subtilisin-like domain-containing protein [Candidatus Paenibacillus intestinavium]